MVVGLITIQVIMIDMENFTYEHVHLEKIDNFLNELNKIEEYDNSYHNVNDGIEDLHAYNEQMKQKVLTKYKHDIELIGFDLTSYV